jgi:hypothetical protein
MPEREGVFRLMEGISISTYIVTSFFTSFLISYYTFNSLYPSLFISILISALTLFYFWKRGVFIEGLAKKN